MKSKIIIVVLVLITIFSTVMSSIKSKEAGKQKTRAEQLEEQLIKTEEYAVREAGNAERMAAVSTEAEALVARLQEELENCKSGK